MKVLHCRAQAFSTSIEQVCSNTHFSICEGRKRSPEMLMNYPITQSRAWNPELLQGSTHCAFSQKQQSWAWWQCHNWQNDSPVLQKCSCPFSKVSRKCKTYSYTRFSKRVLYDPNVWAAGVHVQPIHSFLNGLTHIDCQLRLFSANRVLKT